MHLTVHTDYALRLLMLLAVRPDPLHTIDSVAESYGISRNHMSKVVLTLRRSGFIESVRGRNGGLRLARPADAIRVGHVVRSTEEGFELVECFDAARNCCRITSACGLRHPLDEAIDAFLAVLDRYSLADLVGSPRQRRGIARLLWADAATHPASERTERPER
ncbi:MAG: RrF2 family transcriptional regulator [Alphaproteobacteria bacterium]